MSGFPRPRRGERSMTFEFYPQLSVFGDGPTGQIGHPVGWTLAISFGFHLILLVFVVTIRLPHPVERPTASYHVSLVTLPVAPTPVETPPASPPPMVARPQPIAKPPLPAVPKTPPRTDPKPMPMVKLQPIPQQLPKSEKVPRSSQNLMTDVLQGIELPPEAPRLAEAVPAPTQQPVGKASSKPKDNEDLIGKLTVPDITPVTSPNYNQAVADPATVPMNRQSVLEELNRLEEQLRATQPAPSRPSPESQKPADRTAASTQNTAIYIEGLKPGSNSYFGRVQSLISRYWAPPRVELQGGEPKVVIRFRLHRSGGVSDLTVERSSGNHYYDAAGKRAILSAFPLPPFPADLPQPYVDINFTFGIDRPTG
jgi:colicin import membrane protein